MSNDILKFKIDNGIATVTLNRPKRKNALSIELSNQLTDIWESIDDNDEVKVIILTSTDCGVFCAGMDLKEAAEIHERGDKDILEYVRDPMHQKMRDVKKPIIAAMTGHMMAGGMLLALNSDLRVGLAETKAGITEVKIGRGSPWAMPLISMLPQPILMELVLTGELMPIERLEQFGFINYVEDTPDEVRANAMKLARAIVTGAPLSVRAAKASILAAMNMGCDAAFQEALKIHEPAYASTDAIEGPKAFAEKREPEWQGK